MEKENLVKMRKSLVQNQNPEKTGYCSDSRRNHSGNYNKGPRTAVRGVENDGTQGTLRGWTHSSRYEGDDPAGGKGA